jgi:hypothetical protein
MDKTVSSPKRLAYRVFAGNLCISIWFLLLCLRIPGLAGIRRGYDGSASRAILLFLGFLPILFGLLIALLAEMRLRKGIESKSWQASELRTLDRWFSNRWLLGIVFASFVGCVVYILVAGFRWELFWVPWFPAMTIMRIKGVLNRALKDGDDGGLGLADAKPIASRFWGSEDGSEKRLSH